MQYNEDQLKQVIGNVLGIAAKNIDEATSIDTVASWDSLKHLNLVIALEEHFHVTLTEDESIEILNYPLIKMTLERHSIEFVVNPVAAPLS